MPKLRKICRNNYTVTSNMMWRDPKLGATERGVLGTMLSLPPDWDFSIKGLAKLFPDGERKIGTSLQKIEKAGYLKRNRIYSNGKIVDWEYLYSDEPIFLDDRSENFDSSSDKKEEPTVNPSVENYEENSSETLYCQNSNVEEYSAEESLHCGFADVENVHLENSNANKINNNKYLSHQVSSSRENSSNVENSPDVIDKMDFDRAVAEVEEQISADILHCNNSVQSGVIDEVIEVIATVYTTEQPYLKIGGDKLDIALVRKRLQALDSGHIEYVLECLANSTTVIKNRKNYLLTCLYKAPVTMDGYYSNQVAHDLAKGG